MHRIWREPLLHFFLLGAALFGLFALLNRDALRAPDEIVVDNERLESLRAQFERTWQRPPTATELDGLVENWIRDEILYREGLALGLESDDPVVRRRVVQKVTFLSEAMVDESTTDAELADWLAEHPDRYRLDPRISLRQVYFDPVRRGDALERNMAATLENLRNGGAEDDGDSTLLPAVIEDRSSADVERSFGREFAASVFALPTGAWSGPVRSGFGWHLVRVDALQPGRAPTLDEARDALARDLVAARRRAAADAMLARLRERYTVIRDDTGATVAAGRPR